MLKSHKTSLLLADDHTLVRAGLKSLIGNIGKVEIIGEASDGRETLELAHELKPDLILLDIKMTELNGLEVTARLHKE